MGNQSQYRFVSKGLAAAALCVSPMAVAQDAPESRVSGVVGADINSHFVSYGLDVWAEGDAFSGSDTLNPYAEVSIDFDAFSLTAGVWADINDNAGGGLGGDIQEIDGYIGVGFGYDAFSFGVTYQEWAFASQTEDILDISIGYDDTGLISDDFALSPSIVIHNRVDNGLGLSNGTIIVAGIEPGFSVVDSEEFAIDMSVPVSFGFALDDGYFIAGGDDGFGFFSIGAAFGMPLDMIPADYGAWALNAGVTLYSTESDVYANPDDTFVTYNLGLSLAF
ncbi:MAG: hypothetical protein AAGA25_05250 [Planctomycetota bacterium]